jgi:hypothetical protein
MRANLTLSIVVALILYLEGPFIAGLLGIGDREGPRIYPKEYHTELYKISYEMVRHEKPRISIETMSASARSFTDSRERNVFLAVVGKW